MPGAAFFDLDRTLLRKASGPALSAAMRESGVVRAKFPLESLIFRYFDVFGESLGSIALARQAALVARGLAEGAFDEAAEIAGEILAERVEPFARMLIEQHHEAGRPVVLATTTPEHLVRPFATRLGIDDIVATRYAVDAAGVYTGGLDGPFVWSMGKLSAVEDWAEEHEIDLADSFAYSDSIYDVPLLASVGNPGAVNPDPRLFALALAKRWPILDFNASPGVLKVPLIGVEVQRIGMMLARPETFPYARFKVHGLEHIPAEGGAVIAGNHRSYFDLPTMFLAMGRSGRTGRFLGKREIFDAPIIGPIMRAAGGISVDRDHRDPMLPDPLVDATRALAGGEVIGIMPQGTIPRGVKFFDPVLKGKPGAARLAQLTGVPVIPFAITGSEHVWPRSSPGPHVFGVLNPPTVTVTFGPPVELGYEDVIADTERIMAAISELLPDDVRNPPRPTTVELARTYPKGVVPREDQWFASDAPDDAPKPAPAQGGRAAPRKKAAAKAAAKKTTAKKRTAKKATAKKKTATKKAATKKTAKKATKGD